MSLWKEEYATGNELVDNDHKQIFYLVDSVLKSSRIRDKDKNEAAINFLADYTVKHFAREEELMEESDFPDAKAHIQEHREFHAVAVQLKSDFDNGGYALGELEIHPDTQHLSVFVHDVVIAWLCKHVMGSDKALADHYRRWTDAK
jgi:hemerythrin-like metal-binding protein